MKNFKQIDSNDSDSITIQRKIVGRLTKCRYKIISAYVRKMGQYERCGHSHDCCGCPCGGHGEFKYKQNQVIITYTQYFNY